MKDQNKFMSIIHAHTTAESRSKDDIELKIYLWEYKWPTKCNTIFISKDNLDLFIEKLKTLTGEILLANITAGENYHINESGKGIS